jgi:hypothetical protein
MQGQFIQYQKAEVKYSYEWFLYKGIKNKFY